MAGLIGCMREGCEGVSKARGLCIRHYHLLAKLVKNKTITWAKAEAKGLCMAPKPRPQILGRFERPCG